MFGRVNPLQALDNLTLKIPNKHDVNTTKKFQNLTPNMLKTHEQTPKTSFANLSPKKPAKRKSILYYTPFFAWADWRIGYGHEPFSRLKCPVDNCVITNDSNLNTGSVSDFDAVLFHMRDVKANDLPDQTKRRREQVYVMVLKESPVHDFTNYDHFKDFFNWTSTYRDDSDLRLPYGWIEPIDRPFPYVPNWEETAMHWKTHPFNKTEFVRTLPQRPKTFLNLADRPGRVAWVVSNCQTSSKRERYVHELGKYIPVDIMGGCGQIKCTNVNQTNTCDIALETDYKFYLSFENSLCEQYVTEKFFRRMDQKVVPIVMGKAHYRQMAPPHSHINVQDFHNPKELADYLRHLDKSPEDYLSYFWWKEHFRVRPGQDCFEKMMCRLCEKLNSELTPQSYNDMTSWWRHNGNCQLGSWTL